MNIFDLFTVLGFCVVIYFLIYLIIPYFLDCDLRLAFADKFGKPVETLAGKIVWITGASSGIGEYLSYELAKIGCKLIISARRATELHRIKSKCLSDNPKMKEDDIMVLPFDVCETHKHQELFEAVLNHFGELDILVNNAGRSQRAVWENIDIKVDRDMFELNVFSYLSLTRVVLPHFLKRSTGHVVVMSSGAGLFGIPFSASYTGSKHSLMGYYECLRTEKIDTNLAVTILCPGPIQTNFLEKAFTDKPNQEYGVPTPISKTKMSTERCARLIAVAIAGKLPEVWISPQPILQLMYLNKYWPNLGRLVTSSLGTLYLQNLRDTKETVVNDTKNQ